MSDATVRDIQTRLYRTYLYPPDYQPITNFLAQKLDATDTTIKMSAWSVPEDENLLRVGSILEAGLELMLVTDYDENLKIVTVLRGIYGTPLSELEVGNPIIMNPPFSQYSAYQAIQDNITTLYPKLWTVSADNLVEVTSGVAPIQDDLAVEVVTVWTEDQSLSPNIHGEIVDYHPSTGGRSLITNVPSGAVWLRYKRRMGRVESLTDLLDDLGVDERWINIIMVGAAADLMAGRDIPKSQSEWIGQTLEAETVQVGVRASLSVGLARYRELLMERAQREMQGEYRPKIRMRNAGEDRTRIGIG